MQQFVQEVAWGELDLLLIDAPAGTEDESIAIVNTPGGLNGALVVSTSSRSSLEDVRKAVNFCLEMKVPVLGLVENTAGRREPFVSSSPEPDISRRIEAMACGLQESLGLRQACDCSGAWA